MTADAERWLAASAAALAEFAPLRRAEKVLLRACARGDIARVGLRRPLERSDEIAVRAAVVARLAQGSGLPPGARRVQLLGAWIEGTLELDDCRVPASLWFYRCSFEHAPRLQGARLTGSLSFGDCLLPGLEANHCRIAQDLAVHAGCSVRSELKLEGARIGGDLLASRSQLHDENDRSARRPLRADRARIAGDVRLDEGFEAHGELRFVGARIGGDFIASRARLNGPLDGSGVRRAALVLDRIEVGGSVCLNQGFTAAGRVSLRRALIGGDLDCSMAGFDRVGDATWGDGDALVLDRARVFGTLWLRQLQGPLVGASFADARVAALADDASTWGERVVLDGFSYSRFGDGAPLDATFRGAWLERQPGAHLEADFRMHPWRKLIAVLARMGHRHSASEIALRRERRLRRIGRIGQSLPQAWRWLAHAAHGLHGVLAGHGWRPQRLAGWAVAVWLLCAAGYWAADEQGVMKPARPQAAEAFNPLAYSADRLLPLVDLQQRQAWRPAGAPAAAPIDWAAGAQALGWFEALFGWAALGLLGASLAGRSRRERGH